MRTALRTLQAITSPFHLSNQPLSSKLLSRHFIRKMASQQPPRYPLLKKPVKIACIQLASGSDKATNLSHARDKILEASRSGANIVVLPECFNSPYGTEYFSSYAEQLQPLPPSADQSPSYRALSEAAKEAGVYLVGGSIPELAVGQAAGEDKLGGKEAETEKEEGEERKTYYNTSLVFNPKGELLATHRKVHLFDIDIPGGITFKESDVLSAGNKITLVDLPEYGRIAVGICYDVRFPEMALVAARRGAFALVYPGAFNMTTGPLHWRLLAQGRAVDNQVYVAMCSPARDTRASYHAWGHSMVVDPMAKVLVEAEEGERIVYGELDAETIEKARKGIPLRDQRRFDVYPDISVDERVRLEDELQK
jgi:predicted amidohydrolase